MTDSQRASERKSQPSGLRADVDPDTEDGRTFFQDRLNLFGRWFFIISLSFYVLANLPLDVVMGEREFDWVNEWFGYKELLTLGVTTVASIMWLATRGRARSVRYLRCVDAVCTIAVTTLFAAVLFQEAPVEGQIFQVFVVLLACSNLLTVRAVVVPSTVRRTLFISIAALLPVVSFVAFLVFNSDFSAVKATHTAIAPVMWGAIAIASAAATSRILFRLRKQASAAAKLGHYVLEEEIGQGAMGIVYKARHATLRRPTAIKLLSPERNKEDDLSRFELEVQWTANLTHPNTVAVYDYGRTPDGVFYCVMEYVDGVTLKKLVESWGALPPGRVVQLLLQVCGALAEAHQEGIVHRDIKPANIMVCERGGIPDVVKVLDFGLVKDMDESGDPEQSGTALVGTPAYLSPEAVESPGSIDHRSDLYALGAVAYFLLTGTRLFVGESAVSLFVKHISEEPERPSARLGSSIPNDLEAVVLKCLAKDPSDRPQSAAELAAALAACECATSWPTDLAKEWWNQHWRSPDRAKHEANALGPNEQTMTIDLRGRSRSHVGSPPPR